ncbi:DUF1194 domain-containing protein [Falsiroseomonas sp. E2-1-a20]|uniref:DUF1194 domain-containing protein n=1 Tax=Falsiroseomonas sp. E2-1-a20 TaxID=3239300 RepID=UPI003F3CBAB7
MSPGGVRHGRTSAPPPPQDAVDLLLVLAVDVSSSISEDEDRLQREGYCAALTDSNVLAAVHGGAKGAIGVAYVEWAGIGFQRSLLPWMRIAHRSDAESWSERLASAHMEKGSPRSVAATSGRRYSGTTISRGILFSVLMLDEAPWPTVRRVIDVSGDGADDSAWAVSAEQARDWATHQEITINGLAIEGDPEFQECFPGAALAEYYREAVVGGPGAFVVQADGISAFGDAIRRKLVREIAGPQPNTLLERTA